MQYNFNVFKRFGKRHNFTRTPRIEKNRILEVIIKSVMYQ